MGVRSARKEEVPLGADGENTRNTCAKKSQAEEKNEDAEDSEAFPRRLPPSGEPPDATIVPFCAGSQHFQE